MYIRPPHTRIDIPVSYISSRLFHRYSSFITTAVQTYFPSDQRSPHFSSSFVLFIIDHFRNSSPSFSSLISILRSFVRPPLSLITLSFLCAQLHTSEHRMRHIYSTFFLFVLLAISGSWLQVAQGRSTITLGSNSSRDGGHGGKRVKAFYGRGRGGRRGLRVRQENEVQGAESAWETVSARVGGNQM